MYKKENGKELIEFALTCAWVKCLSVDIKIAITLTVRKKQEGKGIVQLSIRSDCKVLFTIMSESHAGTQLQSTVSQSEYERKMHSLLFTWKAIAKKQKNTFAVGHCLTAFLPTFKSESVGNQHGYAASSTSE